MLALDPDSSEFSLNHRENTLPGGVCGVWAQETIDILADFSSNDLEVRHSLGEEVLPLSLDVGVSGLILGSPVLNGGLIPLENNTGGTKLELLGGDPGCNGNQSSREFHLCFKCK